jgi:hypothetical protein
MLHAAQVARRWRKSQRKEREVQAALREQLRPRTPRPGGGRLSTFMASRVCSHTIREQRAGAEASRGAGPSADRTASCPASAAASAVGWRSSPRTTVKPSTAGSLVGVERTPYLVARRSAWREVSTGAAGSAEQQSRISMRPDSCLRVTGGDSRRRRARRPRAPRSSWNLASCPPESSRGLQNVAGNVPRTPHTRRRGGRARRYLGTLAGWREAEPDDPSER